MDLKSSAFALESGLDLRQVVTSYSILHINEDYDDTDCYIEPEKPKAKYVDFIGQPVTDFKKFESTLLITVDDRGFVKKKIIEEGGGLPLNDSFTVSISFSGYWEGDLEPFDARKLNMPLVVDLKDSGLLPGLEIAVRSMLVGEQSVFLLSHEVMYGEMGIPPRIKPRSSCVFYIKLLRSILTPKDGKLELSEPNMFQRVHHEVKMLYSSGVTLHKTKNLSAAIQLFRKATEMLHRCRLADEGEEQIQEKLLKKLYTNLAVCYNKTKQPLKACIACNELRRLNSFWNNGKVLFQNAKALRMIGQFDTAEKRLKKALKLCPDNKDIEAEYDLLQKSKENFNKTKLILTNVPDLITEEFKQEVNNLIKNFKEDSDLCKLVMPSGLNSTEMDYIRKVCIRENLFFNKIIKDYALDKDESIGLNENNSCYESKEEYSMDKFKETPWDADIEAMLDMGYDQWQP